MHDAQVLVIGGSLVGLSAATFLAWRGVDTIVIEKHAGSALHPRATGFTEHTMEFYRAIGIDHFIPTVDANFRLRRATAASLVDAVIAESEWTPPAPNSPLVSNRDLSPVGAAAFAQDKLEPILRERARELGTDLRLGTELLSFNDTGDGVTARLRERATGREYELTARYMIAADGANSAVGEALGIARHGVGHLMTMQSVLFRCEAADPYLSRGIQQFEIRQEGFKAFLTTYGDSRWVLMFYGGEARSNAEYAADIRRALGADLPFEIITSGSWEMAGRIADSYSKGRVFLAGDAAHQIPPTRGGFGANTGIDDVWNLAWKLEFVLSGKSGPALLDTYSAERQPIGWLRHQQTFARPDYAKYVGDALNQETLYGDRAMELGQLSRSAIVIGSGPELPPAAHPDEWAGQPGTRAPHLWIEKNGERLSTVDLFTLGLVLITEEPRWAQATLEASTETGLPVETVMVGRDIDVLDDTPFAQAFGTEKAGAALVRPDGIIAWRTRLAPEQGARELHKVLRAIAAPNCSNGRTD
jgi:putative polyketide hydroxylase